MVRTFRNFQEISLLMLPWWIQVLHFSRDDSIFSIFYMKVEEQEYAKMLYIVFCISPQNWDKLSQKTDSQKWPLSFFQYKMSWKAFFFHFLKISIRFLFFCAWRWTIRNIQKSFILAFLEHFHLLRLMGSDVNPCILLKAVC